MAERKPDVKKFAELIANDRDEAQGKEAFVMLYEVLVDIRDSLAKDPIIK